MDVYPDLLQGAPAIPGVASDDLAAAAELVRDYCGWHIAPRVTETLLVNGSGSRVLELPTIRVITLTKIVENGDELAIDDYDWSEAGVVGRRRGCWTDLRRGVAVTLEHGWETCPPVVRAVVKRIATSGVGAARVASVGTGPFSVSYFDDDPYAAAILDRYSR